MIKITSLKKQRFQDDKPTSKLYSVESWINPDNIVSIVPTKTSIYDYDNGIDYVAQGSKVTMSNGNRLTSDMTPAELVALIDECYTH
jgi:hypothetical protein